VLSSTLERWSLPTNFGREYGESLRRSTRVRLVHGLTCTEVLCIENGSRVARLETRTLDGRSVAVMARRYVLACGGLETTRLLLNSDRHHRHGIGNHAGHLGRWYMCHLDGRIARVRFSTPPKETIYGRERDTDGIYVRRRLSFAPEFLKEQQLPNMTAWLVNPEPSDPSHGSGVLSSTYLALSSPLGRFLASDRLRQLLAGSRPRSRRGHIRNLVTDFRPTLEYAVRSVPAYLDSGRRSPGFSVFSPRNVYDLFFHGEHRPSRESRVQLARETDRLGMRRLCIDLRFSDRDVDSVVRAHRHWHEHLVRHRCGRLEYLARDVEADVWGQLGGGLHQLGTTRMPENPSDGVVGPDLAVHKFDDLFVASSSTFVTSGHAHPTLTIVALAPRLADHLRRPVRARHPVGVGESPD